MSGPYRGWGVSLGWGQSGGWFLSQKDTYVHVGMGRFAVTFWRVDVEAVICDLIHRVGREDAKP